MIDIEFIRPLLLTFISLIAPFFIVRADFTDTVFILTTHNIIPGVTHDPQQVDTLLTIPSLNMLPIAQLMNPLSTNITPCLVRVFENTRLEAYSTPTNDSHSIGGVSNGVYEVVGFNDGWIQLDLEGYTGWIPQYSVSYSHECNILVGLQHINTTYHKSNAPDGRFAPLSEHRVTQGFGSSHKGFDLATPKGTPLFSPAQATVIRQLNCIKCFLELESFYPCSNTEYSDQESGYGYGNALTLRLNYEDVPDSLQTEMDVNNLTGGYAYILMSGLMVSTVSVGQELQTGDLIAFTGNTGCSSGPHLHFEVKIGDQEWIDGKWLDQIPIHPEIMFDY